MLICPWAYTSKAERTREEWQAERGALGEHPALPGIGPVRIQESPVGHVAGTSVSLPGLYPR